MYLYFYIDSNCEMCMRFLKCFIFFHNLAKSEVSKKSDLLRASFN